MAEKKEYVKLWVSYESYFEAFSDVEVGRLVRAMIKYRASGEEPKLNGNERFIWPAVKRDIDESLQAQESTAAANRENGKKGGRPPKSSKPSGFAENPKNPSGFLESEKSHGLRTGTKDKDKGQGQGQDISAHARVDATDTVLADYLSRINPSASPMSLDELKGFAEVMGPEVCRRAIDIALDSKKASWPYIRAILQDKQRRGVRCLADWDALGDHKKPDTKQQISTQGTDHSWMKQYIEERDRK